MSITNLIESLAQLLSHAECTFSCSEDFSKMRVSHSHLIEPIKLLSGGISKNFSRGVSKWGFECSIRVLWALAECSIKVFRCTPFSNCTYPIAHNLLCTCSSCMYQPQDSLLFRRFINPRTVIYGSSHKKNWGFQNPRKPPKCTSDFVSTFEYLQLLYSTNHIITDFSLIWIWKWHVREFRSWVNLYWEMSPIT